MNSRSQTEMFQEPGSGLARIKSAYESQSPSERKVADYILENTLEFLYQSVSYVAKRCGVGESTVIRFCRSAGFSGFQELKIVLAGDMALSRDYLQRTDSASDLPSKIQEMASENIQAIQETLQLLDIKELERAVHAIANARRVEFYGVSASGITALDAQHKFMRIGVTALAPSDIHVQYMSAETLGKDDVVVGISLTGAMQSIVRSVKKAKKAGATVICITSVQGSPITEVADIVLLSGGKEMGGISTGSIKGKIGQLQVIDYLFNGVASLLGEKATYYQEKTARTGLDLLL